MAGSEKTPSEFDEIIQRGEGHIECGDFESALDLNAKVLAIEPNSVKGIVQRGRIQAGLEKHELALKDYDRAISIDSSDAAAHHGKGVSLFKLNRLDHALASLSTAIDLSPDAVFHLNRAAAYSKNGKVEESREDLKAVTRFKPQTYKDFLALGGALGQLGQVDEAIETLSKSIELNSREKTAFVWRSAMHAQQKNFEQAIKDLSQALILQPENFELLTRRANAYCKLEDWEKAISDFSNAIALEDKSAPAYNWRAYCHSQLEQYEPAIHNLNQAIELEPDNDELYLRRAQAYFECEMYFKSILSFDQALKYSPEDADGVFRRGCAFHRVIEYENALSDFELATQLRETNSTFWWWKADTLFRLERFDEAIEDLDRVLQLAPSLAKAKLLRGTVYFELDELEKSLADFNSAISQEPDNVRAYQWRAYTLSALGEESKANEDYDKADELKQQKLKTDIELGCDMTTRKTRVSTLLQEHLSTESPEEVLITERVFPFRMRADLQRAIDRLVSDAFEVETFFGIRENEMRQGVNFSDLFETDYKKPIRPVAPQYSELEIGDSQTVRCLKNGLWLLMQEKENFAVLLAVAGSYGRIEGIKFQIVTANNESGEAITSEFFKSLEDAVELSECYRGKILSLEQPEPYSGKGGGICVHPSSVIERDEIILPRTTRELLDRNAIGFADKRERLASMGLSTKKGLLFYGPPGTGKTHTIRYLANAMKGHTTLLITAGQIGLLSEYMVLARLLQPSIVVIEDVDLIARNRTEMQSACEEVLLNRLLNEMDGLQNNTDVIFILTTNRPEALEDALASRPGRIDQAIEFPLPDEEGRRKLIRLYSANMQITKDVEDQATVRTEGVSASFIKELMRRTAQFHLENSDTDSITLQDLNMALEELLVAGGSLSRKLLGCHDDE